MVRTVYNQGEVIKKQTAILCAKGEGKIDKKEFGKVQKIFLKFNERAKKATFNMQSSDRYVHDVRADT